MYLSGAAGSMCLYMFNVNLCIVYFCIHIQLTRIAVSEQGAYRQQHFGNGESWGPVVFQYVEAYHSLAVDVTVVYPSPECHLENRHILKLNYYNVNSILL